MTPEAQMVRPKKGPSASKRNGCKAAKKRTYKKIGMVTNRKEQIRDLLQSYLRGLLQIKVATPQEIAKDF